MAASGYTNCACRDCFDLAISDDTFYPELCELCREAGCEAYRGENTIWSDCQRSDAYGVVGNAYREDNNDE